MNKSTTVKRNFTLNLIFLIVAYVAIVAGIGCWVWLNTLKFENDAITKTQQHLLTIAKSESQRIEEFLNTTLFNAKILAKDPLVIKYLKDDLKAKNIPEAGYYPEVYLFEHFNSRVDSMHWLNAQGIVLGGVPFVEEIIGRDESRDPDVKFILENHNSSVNIFEANSGKKFLCICNSVIENGNFLGILRVLISLETINNLVSNVRVGEKGYAWIITEQGIMIAHPKPEHRGIDIMAIRKKTFPDFDWSELEGIVNKMESGEKGIDTYRSAWWTEEKLKIVRKLTAFSPIRINAGQELWSIGVSLSYDEIAGPIKRNALNNFIGAGALILVFGIGGIILFRGQRKSIEIEIITRSAEELRDVNTKLQSEITERKRTEEELSKYKKHLESTIAVRTKELKNTHEKLIQSEKLKAMGVMASGIAHEFNNVLAIIKGFALLAKKKLGDYKKVEQRIDAIVKATNDGEEIVRKMQDFTNVDPDKSEFILTDMKSLIEQTTEFTSPRWRNAAQANSITYNMDKERLKKVPNILGNHVELRGVLINIINNALDAMPDGGRLSFSTWADDSNVFVSISDTGKGMSKEVKENIFDPFFTTKMPTGTGLGMSTVYGIIKNHNGDINIKSEQEKGTTITIRFPITKKTVNLETSQNLTENIETKNLHVLVVDDEQRVCELLSEFLFEEGQVVKTTNSGIEAIELLKKENFDLVLCDWVMPEMSGYDVIKIINRMDNRPKVGLITGWKDKISSIENKDLRVDFIIKKPFEFTELARQINSKFNTV